MIESRGMYVNASERLAFESLRVSANAENTRYYLGTDFSTSFPLEQGQTVNVSYDTFVELDGADPLIIFRGKKYPRGFREGLQSALTPTQMAAVNSGVTAEKVAEHDAKQGALTSAQLAAANSGITAAKVAQYDNYANDKQDALNNAQMSAVNSGITDVVKASLVQYKEVVKNTLSVIASKKIKLHQVMVGALTTANNQEVLTIARRCAEGRTSDIAAFCTEPFTVSIAKYELLNTSNNYEYYFAILSLSGWKVAKILQDGVVANVTGDDFSWGDGEEPSSEEADEEVAETPTNTPTTIIVPYGNGVGEISVNEALNTQNYLGCPCVIIATKKDHTAISSTDVSNFTEVNVQVKITAKDRLQYITNAVNKFNFPKWEVRNVPNQDLMSQMFEVFPQFEQNAEISDSGYPVGFDHYFAVYMDGTNGTFELDFRMYDGENEGNIYVRLYVLGINQYEQTLYLPNMGGLEIVDEDGLLTYINQYPEQGEVLQDVVVCLHNNLVVFGSMEHTITDEVTQAYQQETHHTASGENIPINPED